LIYFHPQVKTFIWFVNRFDTKKNLHKQCKNRKLFYCYWRPGDTIWFNMCRLIFIP